MDIRLSAYKHCENVTGVLIQHITLPLERQFVGSHIQSKRWDLFIKKKFYFWRSAEDWLIENKLRVENVLRGFKLNANVKNLLSSDCRRMNHPCWIPHIMARRSRKEAQAAINDEMCDKRVNDT
jgi:hypothetical protein